MPPDRPTLFRNPTLDAATAYCVAHGFPQTDNPLFPLAVVHHCRLRWIEATDTMLAESAAFLRENGFDVKIRGPGALTPDTRDMRRIVSGRPPLAMAAGAKR